MSILRFLWTRPEKVGEETYVTFRADGFCLRHLMAFQVLQGCRHHRDFVFWAQTTDYRIRRAIQSSTLARFTPRSLSPKRERAKISTCDPVAVGRMRIEV